MSYAPLTFTSDGVTSTYSIPFTYTDPAEVSLSVDDVAYQGVIYFPSSSLVSLSPIPPAGALCVLYRRTSIASPRTSFHGGPIASTDLNAAVNQLLSREQELEVDVAAALGGILSTQLAQAAAADAELAATIAQTLVATALVSAQDVGTRAIWQSINIPSVFTSIRTTGDTVPGIGAGLFVRRGSSQPSHAGKFRDLSLSWWELVDDKPNIAQFGALPCSPSSPTSGPDCHTALSNCGEYARQKGTVARLPAGHWYTSSPPDMVTGLIGEHHLQSFLHYPVSSKGLYMVGSPTAFRSSLVLKDFTLVGPLDGNWLTGQPTSAENGITAAYYEEVFCDIRCQWVRNIALAVVWCGKVDIPNYYAEYGGRDGLYIGGCGNINLGCIGGRHLDDDLVSAHTEPNNTGFSPPSAEILASPPFSNRKLTCVAIAGIDTKGPRFLGAVGTTISTIHMQRPKEHGGFFGGSSSSEGLNDPVNWTVGLHVVEDIIDGAAISAAGGLNSSTDYAGVYIASDPASTGGGTTAVAPGQQSGGTWVLPENYTYRTGTTASVPRGGTFLSGIADLRVHQTLPDTALYSDWGVGKVFTGAGWVDPVMTSHGRTPSAVAVHDANSAFTNLSIKLDVWRVKHGVDLSLAGHISNIKLDFSSCVRIAGNAVNLHNYTGPENGNVDGLLDVTGYFDLDPYLEHSNHAANGTWSVAANGPFVLAYDLGTRLSNVRLHDCTFRNLACPLKDSANMEGGNAGLFYNNVYICQPDTSGDHFSSGNKGVRGLTGAVLSRFIIEGCDPTDSTTYTKRIFCQGLLSSPSRPAGTEWFLKGQIVRNETPQIFGPVTEYYTVHGWWKMTSGDSNTLSSAPGDGGDWVELRCPVDH